MMRDKQWSAPYFWAGFELQGEYANAIVVDHRPWLRPSLVLLFLLMLIVAGLVVFQIRTQLLARSTSN
jgi:hypothetical protein